MEHTHTDTHLLREELDQLHEDRQYLSSSFTSDKIEVTLPIDLPDMMLYVLANEPPLGPKPTVSQVVENVRGILRQCDHVLEAPHTHISTDTYRQFIKTRKLR